MTFEITRTELVWPGKYDAEGNLTITPPANLPFQVVERVNETKATREARQNREATLFDIWEGENEGDTFEDGWRNKLIWGDNKLIMESLMEQFAGKVDLIYIDPPFAVGSDFTFTVELGEVKIPKSASSIEEIAYRDTWGSGNESYVSMIYNRLLLGKQLLSQSASIFVHVDWRMNSTIRLLMDEIYGADSFRNEISWCYTGPSSTKRHLPRKHDSILFYSWGDATYHQPRIAHKSGVHNTGQVYGGEATDASEDIREGLEARGKALEDWWIDIHSTDRYRSELVGYPTQKPEALLGRIIEMATHAGDLVVDLFAGSGTTLAVAEKLNRRWIGSDLGRFSVHTTRKRLLDIENCKPFDILNLGKYERQHWSSIEFGEDLDSDGRIDFFEYVAFILRLYGATANTGSNNLHGKIDKAFVHVGSLSSPVTIQEVEGSVKECAAIGGKDLHILGWEWEMGLMDTMSEFAKSQGVKLLARQIPREVMEVEAARKGQVQFYELAYLNLQINSSKSETTYECELTDFMISNPELVPDVVREKIAKWSDYIDYWAIDWNFQNDTFMPEWMDYRTKQDRSLKLKSLPHTFGKSGTYKVMVKVVDIFGNDTSKIVELKVK